MPDLNTPLDDEDFELLAELLAAPNLPDDVMNVEMLDGFLAALVSGPRKVAPGDYMALVFGTSQDIEWDGPQQEQRLMRLIDRRINEIHSMLSLPLTKVEEGALLQPFLFETDEAPQDELDREGNRAGLWLGRDWADGFAQAVEHWKQDWQVLWDDEDFGPALVPIMLLATGKDFGEESLAQFDPDVLIGDALLATHEIWHFFHGRRAQAMKPGQLLH
jgi:uncharacterized protein